MRMAITDRASADTSPLVLRIEHTSFDRLPPIGAEICAIGDNGWKYYGRVIEHVDAVHYKAEIWTACNKALDNVRNWHMQG